MTVLETLEAYPLFNVAILSHGFTPYMRDYDVIIEADWLHGAAGRYQYRFTHCVEAKYETVLRQDTWQESWDDVFIDYQRFLREGEPDGYVWGVEWSLAYPGWEYLATSQRAQAWSENLGKTMHEISVETDAYKLHLVFYSLKVRKIGEDINLIKQVFIPLKDW